MELGSSLEAGVCTVVGEGALVASAAAAFALSTGGGLTAQPVSTKEYKTVDAKFTAYWAQSSLATASFGWLKSQRSAVSRPAATHFASCLLKLFRNSSAAQTARAYYKTPMNVRIFGYDVEITGGFLMTAVIMGMSYAQTNPAMILVLVLVLFFSILIHELGHALAFKAFGVRSSIRLQFLGGVTIPEIVIPLTRPRQIVVSFAGPLFGYLLAGFCFLIDRFVDVGHPGLQTLLGAFVVANIVWSTFNLVPVLPLDGGHILQAALGPKRLRWTFTISGVVGVLAALYSLRVGSLFGVFIFAMAAFQAFSQLRNVSEAVRTSGEMHRAKRDLETPADEATVKALKEAKLALDSDRADETLSICEPIANRESGRAQVAALTLIGWALLQKGEFDKAAEVVQRLNQLGAPDPALYGSVALARGDLVAARNVLEAARFSGDSRKEVFGPLIQVFLRLGEPARSAALAVDCFDGISTEDARALASMVAEQGAYLWAGRLYEACFKRDRDANDAFDAARMFARASDRTRAVDLMKIAVAAGFDDSARVYADEALVGLDELDHVVPRPS